VKAGKAMFLAHIPLPPMHRCEPRLFTVCPDASRQQYLLQGGKETGPSHYAWQEGVKEM
jgi:hypothetical protein